MGATPYGLRYNYWRATPSPQLLYYFQNGHGQGGGAGMGRGCLLFIIYYLLLDDLFSIYYLKSVDNISLVAYNVFNQSGAQHSTSCPVT